MPPPSHPSCFLRPQVCCDGCNQRPILGRRHKSLAHPDYDLCDACLASGRFAASGPFTALELAIPLHAGVGLESALLGMPSQQMQQQMQPQQQQRPSAQEAEARLAQVAQLLESCERLALRTAPELSRAAASLRSEVSREPRDRQHAAQASVLQACQAAQALGALLFDTARLLSTTTVVSGEVPPGSTVGGPRGVPISRASPGVWHRGQPLLVSPSGGLHPLPPGSAGLPAPQQTFFGSAHHSLRTPTQPPPHPTHPE